MRLQHALALLLMLACDGTSPSSQAPPPIVTPPVFVTVVNSSFYQLPDSVGVSGDSITILRTYPVAGWYQMNELVPTLTVSDSVLVLDLDTPAQLTAAPDTFNSATLRLATRLLVGSPKWTRFVQVVRSAGQAILVDTIPLPAAPVATLPPLQIAGTVIQRNPFAIPAGVSATVDSSSRLRVAGSFQVGGEDVHFQSAIMPTLSDTSLTLGVRFYGGPFAAIQRIAYRVAVDGLTPGTYTLFVGLAGSPDTLEATIPATAP